MADLLQFAILIWYHQRFGDHWLHSTQVRTLGTQAMVAVEDARSSFVDAPTGIENYQSNPILELCARYGQEDKRTYGLAGLPSRLMVPSGVRMRVYKENWPAPHLRDQTMETHVLFEAKRICTVEVSVGTSGFSILAGKEKLLPVLPAPASELHEWYSFDYFVSVRVRFVESWPLRLGWGRNKHKMEQYYRWAREILEGLEEDFCWPLSSS